MEKTVEAFFLKMQSATVSFAQECTMDRGLGRDPWSRVSMRNLGVNSSHRLRIGLWRMVRRNE